MFDIMEWYTKHAKKLDKKYYAKGESIYVLHRRTLQTAKSIIDLINDIPADDLFLELYMLVKDKEFGSFVGRYQYVLEIAIAYFSFFILCCSLALWNPTSDGSIPHS